MGLVTAVAIWATCAVFVIGVGCFTARRLQVILEATDGREWL